MGRHDFDGEFGDGQQGKHVRFGTGADADTGLSPAIYYAKNIGGGSNTVTVAFNQARRIPNIRDLEYSGLDTANPLDVVSAASGTGTTANSGSATTTAASELIVGAGNPVTAFTGAGSGFSNRVINGIWGDLGRQDRQHDGKLQRYGDPDLGRLGDADGDVPRERAGRGRESGADGEWDCADVGDDGGWNAGDDHGHGLPGGRDGDDRGHGGDGGDGSEQHVDHGDDTGARCGRGECGGEKYGWPDGNIDQRLHLYESGADGERDCADVGDDGGWNAGDDHGHGLPGGRDGDDRGHGGDGVTVASSTSITATTPAHAAGAASVVVKNTDSQSGTLTNGYTYTSSGGGGGISFVQVKSAVAGSGSSIAATFAGAQTAGNLNVVAVMWGDTTSTVSAVTDSRGNTYALALGPTRATGLSSAIYYAKNIGGGSNTVTVAFNQSAAIPI